MNEMREATHWAPGIVVLAAGAVLAAIFLLITWRRGQAKVVDVTLADLEQRARLLIDQLRELTAERHVLGEERFAAEKTRLEHEAAAALRARDEYAGAKPRKAAKKPEPQQKPAAQAAAAAARTGFSAQHPQLVGALWGGGAVLFFVVLGLVLSSEEKPRTDMPKGGPQNAQAKAPPGAPGASSQDEAALQEAMTRLSDRPDDLDLADRVAHELIRRQRFDDAERITEQSLGFDPFNVEARVHRAVLRTTHGQSEQAIEELEHLAMTYPHAEEARLFLGGLRMDLGDRRGALAAFERYLADAPPDDVPPQLPQVISQLRASLPPAPAP